VKIGEDGERPVHPWVAPSRWPWSTRKAPLCDMVKPPPRKPNLPATAGSASIAAIALPPLPIGGAQERERQAMAAAQERLGQAARGEGQERGRGVKSVQTRQA
jgi:hypothetical protein